jgi:GMP synthase (glutamine-hydrolysing)
MPNALIIVHQATSNPGRVGDILTMKGYTLTLCCPALGDRLPDSLERYDAVVVFGGPMSANDDNTLPFIREELDWIPTVLDAGKPYLGICLGAQLLARVLGSSVAPHPENWREIGYFPIQPTTAGRNYFEQVGRSPHSHAAHLHVYHWHQEGFDVPRDAVLLATGDRFPNQAFRYGSSAYGLQFHPEITDGMIHDWTIRAADQLTLKGAQSREEQLHHHTRFAPVIQDWLTENGEFEG